MHLPVNDRQDTQRATHLYRVHEQCAPRQRPETKHFTPVKLTDVCPSVPSVDCRSPKRSCARGPGISPTCEPTAPASPPSHARGPARSELTPLTLAACHRAQPLPASPRAGCRVSPPPQGRKLLSGRFRNTGGGYACALSAWSGWGEPAAPGESGPQATGFVSTSCYSRAPGTVSVSCHPARHERRTPGYVGRLQRHSLGGSGTAAQTPLSLRTNVWETGFGYNSHRDRFSVCRLLRSQAAGGADLGPRDKSARTRGDLAQPGRWRQG